MLAIAGATLTLAVLFWTVRGSRLSASVTDAEPARLPACEGDARLFPESDEVLEGLSIVDDWAQRYHSRVSKIIEEDLQNIRDGGTCDESVQTAPTDSLRILAKDLGRQNVHQSNLPDLLLEYLRRYECALHTESFVIEDRARYDLSRQLAERNETATGINFEEYAIAVDRERRQINRELSLAQSALHRTLVYRSGYSRLQPLAQSLQCLAGATVDIKNALGLAAEASACLPRIWDAGVPVRTLPPASNP